MTEIELAVLEWREARLAFFAVASIGMNLKERFPENIWKRLGNAEHKLMQLSDALDEIHG